MPEIKVESPLLSSLNNSTPKPVMKTKTSDQQEKEQAQKNVWIDKIKAIKSIKGYELKNNQITYEAEVWDKNGQTLFVPPLSSETVKKIDKAKLATFLQDCLVRDYHESQGQVSGRS